MNLASILINNRVTVGKNCVFHINTALVAGEVDDAGVEAKKVSNNGINRWDVKKNQKDIFNHI